MVEKLIQKYYGDNPVLHEIYLTHVRLVRDKALDIARQNPHLEIDMQFVDEASMLHDIGIFLTKREEIGAIGKSEYSKHGTLGRELLENEGLSRHALVAERHSASGLSIMDIRNLKLPLPLRDMLPITTEEKLICLADCFYSKNPKHLTVERTVEEAREKLVQFGEEALVRFDEFVEMFSLDK